MKSRVLNLVMALLLLSAADSFPQQYEWAKRIGGTGTDWNGDMATDAQGHVYVTGSFQGSNVDFDPGPGTAYLNSAGNLEMYLAKYDSAGNFVWAKAMGGTGNDFAARIAVDASGNAYVIGWFESPDADFDPGPGSAILGTAGSADIFFAKYDSDGNYLWAHRAGGTNNDGCHDVALDSKDNVYLTGYFNGMNIDFDPGPGTAYLSSVASSGDVFIAKYDSSGGFLWAKGVGGPTYEVGNAIALDDSGYVYITGAFTGTIVDFDPGPDTTYLSSSGAYDIFLARYKVSGALDWARKIGGVADDIGADILVSPTGAIYAAGRYHGTNIDFDPGTGTALLSSRGAFDAYVAKYDRSASCVWATSIGGTSDDYGNKIMLDDLENVLLAGTFQGMNIDFDPGSDTASFSSAGGSDVFVAEYTASGNYSWALRLGGATSDADGGIAIGDEWRFFVGGGFGGANVDFDPGPGVAYLSSAGAADIFLACYFLGTTGARRDGESGLPVEFQLLQNYPNPFNPFSTVGFSIAESRFVTLKVYDILGREVAVLVNEKKMPGMYEVEFDASGLSSGVYFYRLAAGQYVKCRKMVLTK
jgi:hypothetical protein